MATAKEVREAIARGEGPLCEAADDEPIFIIRAGQRFDVVELVEHWAHRAHIAGRPDSEVIDAAVVAEAMRDWQRRNPKPD